MPMMARSAVGLALLLLSASLAHAQNKPTWDPNDLPPTTEDGQTGTNQCNATDMLPSSQTSMCQTAYVNSLEDFCLWAPPVPNSDVGATEEHEVAWCTAPGRGTRLIPPGAILGAHFVKTPNYVQITGQINGPLVNIARGDEGGELDPHGATGNGNPIGSLIFTTAFGGGVRQVKEWMNFMSDGEWCIRICNPDDPNAAENCQHVYDVMGCDWVMPGDYSNAFDTCAGNAIEAPGVYGGSTFSQGDPVTPPAHPAGATSQCTVVPTIVPSLAANASGFAAPSSSLNSTSSVQPSTTSTVPAASTSKSAAPTTSATATATASTSGAQQLVVPRGAGWLGRWVGLVSVSLVGLCVL